METVSASVRLGRLVLYVKDVAASASFYCNHFSFTVHHEPGDRIVELRGPDGGVSLLLHPKAKAQKSGQVLIKLVFDVCDVPGFAQRLSEQGLKFGPIQRGGGYVFCNAKDPDGNAISLSSRAFRTSSGLA